MAQDCAKWLEQKAEIKTIDSPVFQNLFHIKNVDGSTIAIHGSSPFTISGLGFTPTTGYPMNTLFTSEPETKGLLDWFDSIWDNSGTTWEIKF